MTTYEGITSVDLMVIIREIKNLEGGIIENIYQSENMFILKIRANNNTYNLVLEPEYRINITKLELKWNLTNFVMMLRKHIRKKKIISIEQYDFDRIVIIRLSDNYEIILELIKRGVLCLCKNRKIILASKHLKMKDRQIIPGRIYSFPPGAPGDIQDISLETFVSLVNKQKNPKVALLKLGFGHKYSNELLYNMESEEYNDIFWEKLYKKIISFFSILNDPTKISPRIYYDNAGKPITFSVIELNHLKNFELKTYSTLNDAIDDFFSLLRRNSSSLDKLEKEKKKILKRIEKQKKRINNLKDKIREYREKAHMIITNLALLQEITDSILAARKIKNLSWEEIKKRIMHGKKIGNAIARYILDLNEKGDIKVQLGDYIINLNIRFRPQEIANELFDKAKKFETKLQNAIEELKKSENVLQALEKNLIEKSKLAQILIKQPKKRWFHKFRWFLSSDNFLVVGGRDASSNELLVKRYLGPNDVFVHAEIHGGSVVIIKNEEKMSIPERTLREAAIFAAAYSNAWEKGFSSIDVFWTKPEHVSLAPPSGQYLAKGGFIIKKKNILKNIPLILSIGLLLEELNENTISFQVISGPPEAISKRTDILTRIRPGYREKSEIAKSIISYWDKKFRKDIIKKKAIQNIKLEKIIELIPGSSALVEGDNLE